MACLLSITLSKSSKSYMQIELEVEKGREIITLLQSLKNLQNQVDETNDVLLREREDAYKGSGGDDAFNPGDDDDDASNPDDDAKKETHSEVQNLKVMVLSPILLRYSINLNILQF